MGWPCLVAGQLVAQLSPRACAMAPRILQPKLWAWPTVMSSSARQRYITHHDCVLRLGSDGILQEQQLI